MLDTLFCLQQYFPQHMLTLNKALFVLAENVSCVERVPLILPFQTVEFQEGVSNLKPYESQFLF